MGRFWQGCRRYDRYEVLALPMGNDDLVRTTFVTTRQLVAQARAVGGGNLSKGCNLLMQGGIESLNGSPTLDLSDADLAELLAHRLRERQQALSVSGSGAALLSDPTPDRIDALRLQGAGVIVTRSGLLVPGLTPEGLEALLVVDLEAGVLAITAADGSGQSLELGESLPALGCLAALVSGTLTRCWEAVRQGKAPASAPQGQRPDWGLVIWPAHASDGLSRVALGDAVICLHSLQLLQLSSELFGLLARRSAALLQTRAELEQLVARPPADAPAVALQWERTHGE
jgi:hypothetical protein